MGEHRSGWFTIAMGCAIAIVSASIVLAQDESEPAAMPTQSRMRAARLPPTISLTAAPSYGVAPLTVGFLVNANDPEDIGFVSYRWTFGDGNISTLAPPILIFNTYTQPGTYLATLTAATADGRAATGFAGVIVKASVAP